MHHKIPLPRGWNRRVRSSVLHILASATTTCWNNGPLHGTPGPVQENRTANPDASHTGTSSGLASR